MASEPVRLWRIGTDTPQYEAHDLTGRGAERSGGRWNRPGTALVYASTSRALACLESVVHLGADSLPLNRYLVEITLPAELWAAAVEVDAGSLVGWDAMPVGKASLDWGSAWIRAQTSLLARVPSVIVPEEMNVLINPAHPDAAQLRAVKRRKWLYDARLGRG
jgi:RES domain-containing protein